MHQRVARSTATRLSYPRSTHVQGGEAPHCSLLEAFVGQDCNTLRVRRTGTAAFDGDHDVKSRPCLSLEIPL